MADQVYAPFTSSSIGARPFGPGNAIDVSQRDEMANKAQTQTLQDMALAYQQKQAELDRYRQLTEPEVQIKGYEGALANMKRNSPEFMKSELAGGIGRNQSAQAEGQFQMDTVGSRTALGNEQNNYQALGTAIQRLAVQNTALPPLAREANYQQFLSTLPVQTRRMMPSNYIPGAMEAMASQLINTPAHRQKIGEIEAQGDQHARWATISAEASERARKYAADAAERAAWARFGGREAQQKVESVINQYLMKKFNGKQTTPQQDAVFQAAQQIMYNVRAAGGGADRNQMMGNMLGVDASRQVPTPVAPPVPKPDAAIQLTPQAIQSKLQELGWPYEPDKYEYGINPDTGNFARRPKQK